MKNAIVSGTFDPITSGHTDIIRRAARLFDKVYVVAVNNTEKKCMFSADERLSMVNAVVEELKKEGITNVVGDVSDGLTADYMHANGISVIVRGARNASDFDYEYTLAGIMKRYDAEFETVVLPASPTLSCVSSTYVRDLVKYGCELGDSVPSAVAEIIKRR